MINKQQNKIKYLISGKWWGDTSKQPILAIHGWQDNACSFDPLLALLPLTKPVLAIDAPGHGFSSHYPPMMMYQNPNYMMICRRIQKYFNWNEKMTILGHSQGGVIGFLFSAIYSEHVNALMVMDAIKPFTADPGHFDKLGRRADKFIDVSRRTIDVNPMYTLKEIENRWVKAVRGSLTPEAVRKLMKRGVKFDEASGKYSLTRDPKLKMLSLHRFTENQCLELAHNMTCHYLSIKFSKGEFVDHALKKAPNFISAVTQRTKSFKHVTVEGTHHGHLNNPENVAPVIIEFLKAIDS